jgi:hypothetical protein
MTLHSIPHIHRQINSTDTPWGEWEKQFAWIPIKLPHKIQGRETEFRWLWFKTYWQRKRSGVAWVAHAGLIDYTQYDYAFTVLDLLRKS